MQAWARRSAWREANCLTPCLAMYVLVLPAADCATHRFEPFYAFRYPPYTEEGYKAMTAAARVEIPSE